jgi:alpha-ribazole phosphatase
VTRFWWVRHGPTHAKGMVGWSDIAADLSDTAQIARLADYLPKGAPVISSDLSRAVATADAIAGTRTRLTHDPDLREINFGAWELLRSADIERTDAERLRAFYETPGEVRPPQGESWDETSNRVSRGVERLLNSDAKDIIVVAHFGAILTQVQRALHVTAYEAFAQRIDNFSVTQIQHDGHWHAGPINHIP